MANKDAPRGFTPVKHTSGAMWTGEVRAAPCGNAEDIFIGDFVSLVSGLVLPADTNDATLLGVAVGFGKKDDMTNFFATSMNPDNLTTLYYDDSANTHTDWVVYYVPARDMIFEVQTAVDLSASTLGATVDLLGTGGNTTTGRSAQEVTTSSNADFIIVERPQYPNNDATLINEKLFVQAVQTEAVFD